MAVGSVAEEKDGNLAYEQDRAAEGGANGEPQARRRHQDAAQRVSSRPNWARASRPPQVSETSLHKAVAEFLDWTLAPPAMFTTFPAGWSRMSKSKAGLLKACGLVAGMPDLLLFHKGRAYGIELKTPNGRLSPRQRVTIIALRRAGLAVMVCRSIEDVRDALKCWDIPLRNWVREII